MASSPSTSQTPYHEYEPIDPSEKFLLCSKKKDYFKVGCSKALLNCLLQRQQFKQNIVLRLLPSQLESNFLNLKLQEFFKLNELEKWFSGNEANSIGSIIAAKEKLLDFNVFLCPIDHSTYTVLVERPTGFFCLINNSWVIIREIGGRWFQLDTRNTRAIELTESYLCMIIKQLLVDNLPVFRISGEGFSRSNASHHISQSMILKSVTNKSIQENCTSYPLLNSDSNLVRVRLPSNPLPQPPDQLTRENLCRLQNALKGLDISSETTKKTKIKTSVGDSSDKRESERKSRIDHQKPVVHKSTCCICLESSPDHALVPCGHQCLCFKCKTEYLKKFKTCPICSKVVTNVIKIYKT